MRFRIDLKIFLFLALFYLTRQIETYAIIMILAILHELGHLVAGLLLGMKPEKIELMPLGVSISFKLNTKDYNIKIRKANRIEVKKIIVALAGPVTNIILIILTMYLKVDIFLKLLIIYSNILIIAFNILPIYPLDGGRILKGILHIYFGLEKARKYSHQIAKIMTIVLTALASIAILYFENIAIFFIIMYLWILIGKEERTYVQKEKLYETIRKVTKEVKNEKQIQNNIETAIEKN